MSRKVNQENVNKFMIKVTEAFLDYAEADGVYRHLAPDISEEFSEFVDKVTKKMNGLGPDQL